MSAIRSAAMRANRDNSAVMSTFGFPLFLLSVFSMLTPLYYRLTILAQINRFVNILFVEAANFFRA